MQRFLTKRRKRSRFLNKYGLFVVSLLMMMLVTGVMWRARVELVRTVHAQAQAAPANGSGFLWSDTFGWISLNCLNDWDNNGTTALEDHCTGSVGSYGVNVAIDATTLVGTFSGWGWSPYVGFVCFGATCQGPDPDGNMIPQASFNFNADGVVEIDGPNGPQEVALARGFARIVGHQKTQADGGWIRLRGRPGFESYMPENGGVGARIEGVGADSRIVIGGSAWQENTDRTGAGWVFFGTSPPGNSNDGNGECDNTIEDCVPSTLDNDPARETSCDPGGLPCCANSIDDDNDIDYAINGQHERKHPAPDNAELSGVDCRDYDCATATDAHCSKQENLDADGNPAPAQCFDHLDNDLDAYVRRGNTNVFDPNPNPDAGVDCSDRDCRTATWTDTSPGGTFHSCAGEFVHDEYNLCYNGKDDDKDGSLDCADPDCKDFVTCVCSNLQVGHEECGTEHCSTRLNRCVDVCPPGPRGENGDRDGDNVCNVPDNCPLVPNPKQEDGNANGKGDACDPLPWLQSQQGSLYGQGFNALAPPPGGIVPNAEFCILSSGTITNFREQPDCVASSDARQSIRGLQIKESPGSIALLNKDDRLGSEQLRARLDIEGLQGRAVNPSATLDATALRSIGASNTGGNIYYHQGDLTINDPITWQAGPVSGSGARTIIVAGNLTINAPSHYGSVSAGTPLRQLPSVAWIVIDPTPTDKIDDGGNIMINPNVGGSVTEDLVGVYVAARTIHTGVTPARALTVRGIMVARSFALERSYVNLSNPSEHGAERIIYDGRILLNPPPGLTDFVKALPQFKSVAPQ